LDIRAPELYFIYFGNLDDATWLQLGPSRRLYQRLSEWAQSRHETSDKGKSMNLKDIATELAALTVLKDAVKEATDHLRQLAKEELLNVGADMTKAIVDNQEVAKVSLVSRDCDFVITDDRAFLAWVKENAGTEIEERVRDSYKKVFIESLQMGADNAIFSTLNGSLVDFVQLVVKEPYVSTRFATGGRDIVVQALHDRRLTALPWLNAYVQSPERKEID
jgi:hypothetical protein